jgi:hypothetical protein
MAVTMTPAPAPAASSSCWRQAMMEETTAPTSSGWAAVPAAMLRECAMARPLGSAQNPASIWPSVLPSVNSPPRAHATTCARPLAVPTPPEAARDPALAAPQQQLLLTPAPAPAPAPDRAAARATEPRQTAIETGRAPRGRPLGRSAAQHPAQHPARAAATSSPSWPPTAAQAHRSGGGAPHLSPPPPPPAPLGACRTAPASRSRWRAGPRHPRTPRAARAGTRPSAAPRSSS